MDFLILAMTKVNYLGAPIVKILISDYYRYLLQYFFFLDVRRPSQSAAGSGDGEINQFSFEGLRTDPGVQGANMLEEFCDGVAFLAIVDLLTLPSLEMSVIAILSRRENWVNYFVRKITVNFVSHNSTYFLIPPLVSLVTR